MSRIMACMVDLHVEHALGDTSKFLTTVCTQNAAPSKYYYRYCSPSYASLVRQDLSGRPAMSTLGELKKWPHMRGAAGAG